MKQPDPRTFRRLRSSDAFALRELCLQDDRWGPHFRKHDEWLNKAIESIGSEGRLVFGGFSDDVEDPSTLLLDSAIFLKTSPHNNSAELKNLVLRDEGVSQRLSEEGLSASVHLIEKAVRFCEMRDIEKLEIELPQSEHAFISIFLAQGFKIISQRERYYPGQSVCILEKIIGQTYYGDPFDRIQLGTWLLHSILACKVGQWKPFDRQSDLLVYIPFEVFPVHPAFSSSNAVGSQRRLRGGLFILDDSECTAKYFGRLELLSLPVGSHVNYLMADKLSPSERERMREKGYVCFDREEVRSIAGGDDSSLRIPFDRSQIAGVLTVLEEKRIREYAQIKGSFIYFLLGRIGDSLTVESQDETDSPGALLAIHCPKWENGRPAVVGFAEVIQKTKLPISVAYDLYPVEIPRALDEQDLKSYAVQGGDEKIVELLCSRLTLFEQPFHYDDPLWSDYSEAHDYIVTELEHANSTYLGRDICDLFRALGPKGTVASDIAHRSSTEGTSNAVDESKAEIVVIVMREDEQNAILSRLPNASAYRGRRGAYLIGEVATESNGVLRVAVLRTQEQGPGEAQHSAHSAIEDLHPQWLALVGIAGGVPHDEFTLGDVVIASRVHDFSVSAFVESSSGEHIHSHINQGGPMPRVIGDLIGVMAPIFTKAMDWNSPASIGVDRPTVDLSKLDLYGSEKWRNDTAKSLEQLRRSRPIVTTRACASSGDLIKDTEALVGFINHSRDVAIVEMELGGVYKAAQTTHELYPVLAVRGVSDIVGLRRSGSWTSYACNTAAAAFFTLLRGMPEGFLEPGKRSART